MYCTSFAGNKAGRADNNRCIWSAETAPRTITTSRASQIWRIRSRARSGATPQYLVAILRAPDHVILQSKTACALCLYSAIPSLWWAWNQTAESGPPQRRWD